jgi:hypothetical protein
VRDATNRRRFLKRIEPLVLDFVLLSGEDEARLSVLPVANGFALEDGWVIELSEAAKHSHLFERAFGRTLELAHRS